MSNRPGVRGPIYIIILGVLSVTGYLSYRDGFMESDFEKTYFAEHRFNRLLRTCEEGKSNQCNRLAMAYQNGHGTTEDLKAAFQTFEKACELGGFFGCYNVGLYYQYGYYPEVDEQKAYQSFRTACMDRKHPWACIGASTIAASTEDDDLFSPRASLELMTRGCEIGLERACVLKAKMIDEGRVKLPADPKEAGAMKTRAAEVMENACTKLNYALDCIVYWEKRFSSDPDFESDLLRRAISACRKKPELLCATYFALGERHGVYDAGGKAPEMLAKDCAERPEPCFVRGKIAEEAKDLELARMYFEMSCTRDRFVGCGEALKLTPKSSD